MGALADVRAELYDDLKSIPDAYVYNGFDANPQMPCIMIEASQSGSYLETGPGFVPGDFRVTVDVLVMVQPGDKKREQRQLDELIEQVLDHSKNWAMGGVLSPPEFAVNGRKNVPGYLVRLNQVVSVF